MIEQTNEIPRAMSKYHWTVWWKTSLHVPCLTLQLFDIVCFPSLFPQHGVLCPLDDLAGDVELSSSSANAPGQRIESLNRDGTVLYCDDGPCCMDTTRDDCIL